jgi:predicted O-linked N-acetylglucosamine transferase (SPINDLY family)
MSGPGGQVPTELAERYEQVRAHAVAFRSEQAIYAAKKLPAKHAGHVYALAIRGLLEWSVRRFPQAVGAFREAVSRAPTDDRLRADLADMLWAAGDQPGAIREWEIVHHQKPTDRRIIALLAERLHRMNLSHLAYAYARKLVDLDPDSADAQFILAYRAADLRRYEESLRHFALAGKTHPADARYGQGRFFVMLYAGCDPLEIRRESEAWCAAAYEGVAEVPAAKLRRGGFGSGRVRIGVVSADLRNHVVASFFGGVLRDFDRSEAEFVVFSNTDMPDAVTARVAGWASEFHDISALSDDAAVELIRSRGIDVLIDLSGHTGGSRRGGFARRGAPVQATYLGYPATTGLRQMDYRLTDAIADPVGLTESHCSEKLVRLGRCAWAFSLEGSRPLPGEIGAGPSGRGEAITFGSFNLLTKVNQASVSLWARVLSTLGTGRMLMTDRRGLLGDPAAVQLLREEFSAGGADLSRVMLASFLPDTVDQRRRLADIDLMFDPLSYNGTTTTCEALWYGVPTLTLPGTAHVSRVGASLLTAAGLEQFIARDASDFVAKAAALTADPTPLHLLRRELPERYRQSALHDFRSLARSIVSAARQMVSEA